MRVCLMIEGQESVTWEEWLELAKACEESAIDALFRSDHYQSVMGQTERSPRSRSSSTEPSNGRERTSRSTMS